MRSPIFGFDVKSKFDQYGEVPIVSTFTSVVRFAKGVLFGLGHVICLNGEGLKQDARDVTRAVFEVVPVVNMFTAYVFGYCDQWNALYNQMNRKESYLLQPSLADLEWSVNRITQTTSFLTRSRMKRIELSVKQKLIAELQKKQKPS